MSSEVVHASTNAGGTNTQRKRRNNKNKQHYEPNPEKWASYQDVAFHERPSSGRPGSPHRYFDDSFTVVFNNGGSDVDGDGALSMPLPLNIGAEASGDPTSPSLETPSQPIIKDDDLGTNSNPTSLCGNQVVHRHLNGLCIVTAGNVLEKLLESKRNNDTGGNDDVHEEVGISSIQYLVKVGKDSQSAKGKLRTKNKKQKRARKNDTAANAEASKKAVTNHDGNVSPHDPLCRITLSNGQVIQLNCCVAGTVIELNQQLDTEGMGLLLECKEEGKIMNTDTISHTVVKEVVGNEKGSGIVGSGDLSLLLKDPLLDGHLAVIMPTRGDFPPK
mmetsp:Transcript_2546/g.5438  ORF Transcript_2546/g.5438 Transcript_2546/m.5438 type:complete len:331 (-) Transcript_2546:239-1231(-)